MRAETAFLPRRLNARLSKNQDPVRIRWCKFWRIVLERLILALADQQLVTGFAILITGWIVYHEDIYTAHFTLVIYLSSLSSSSHLAAIVTLRKYFSVNPTLALLRIILIAAFAVVLTVSIAFADTFGPFYSILFYLMDATSLFFPIPEPLAILISIWPILWTFWTGIWQVVPKSRDLFAAWIERRCWLPMCSVDRRVLCFQRLSAFIRHRTSEQTRHRLKKCVRATLHYMFFLSPGSVFVLQIIFAAISVAMVLAQKFSPGDPGYECSLNSKDENKMGYGQILAFLMLTLPAIAAVEAYKGEQYLPETHVNTTEADM